MPARQIRTIVPPNGIHYKLNCECTGIHYPTDAPGDTPVLGGEHWCPGFGPTSTSRWSVIEVRSLL